MTMNYVALLLLNVFPASEIFLTLRRRAASGDSGAADQGSLKTIWKSILIGMALAILCRLATDLPLPLTAPLLDGVTSVLILAGMTLRWSAVLTLGRHFTVNLAIIDSHRLIRSGPYRWVRHPSYSGLLLAWLGCGFFTNNIGSIILSMLPVLFAICRRIRIEEQLLENTFAEYRDYCQHTWKLFPCIW